MKETPMAPMIITFRKDHPDARLPTLSTPGSAGADLHAVMPEGADLLVLQPGARLVVSTGLAAAIPRGWEIQIRPRSGIAVKYGVTVVNSPGTLDSDYRGVIGVALIHLGEAPFEIRSGDRIAQIVLAEAPAWKGVFVDSLDETSRGEGGFGSTGKSG
jgi:dUTP pyrophosphatase